MPASPAPFVGFTDPPAVELLRAPSWKRRVEALALPENRGKWACYGPYAGKRSASRAATTVRQSANHRDWNVQVLTHMVDINKEFINQPPNYKYFIYIKVEERNGIPKTHRLDK